jgi:hypothetical protein
VTLEKLLAKIAMGFLFSGIKKTVSTVMDYLGWEFSNLDRRLSLQLSIINNITIPITLCSAVIFVGI